MFDGIFFKNIRHNSSNSNYTLLNYFSYNGYYPGTAQRVSEGSVKITFPSSWSTLGLTDTTALSRLIVHVEGTVHGSSQKLLKATVTTVTSSYIQIDLADDASANDGAFFIDVWII
jgi:hypothetical protein